MSDERVHRRLAAILVADVVGYSLRMGQDETGTRSQLNAIMESIVQPLLDAHRGRMFKTTGDGFLAEFASVVDAVDCAVEIQEALNKPEKSDPDQLQLRVGINLGDVIIEDDDVHGDGVNVAARLEAQAEPGGICISRSARDQIRDKVSYSIEDMGEIEVKNIARPVRAFRVLRNSDEIGGSVRTATPPRRARAIGAAVVAGIALVVAGALIWFEPWAPRIEAASVANMKLPLPNRPSVAVLPFVVSSNGADDAFFAEAIAEDLTRSLARVSGLFVIARSSTLDFVGERASPARAAEELGVRHVVRATLRRSGDRVRIDAALIDAVSGRIVWSDRLEHASDDVFDLQDDLVQALASRLSIDLVRTKDQPRFTSSPEAFFLWMKADHQSWLNTPEGYDEARVLANDALRIDPDFARAKSILAFVDTQIGYFRIAEDPRAALDRALVTARLAIEAEPEDWYSRAVLAQALMNLRQYEAADAEYARAIEMEPAHPRLLTRSALPLIFLGRGKAAEKRLRVAVRLNPSHGWLPDQLLGQALYIQERYREAAEMLDVARKKNPRFIGNMWWRAATHGQLGNEEKAAEAVAEILALMPGAAISKSFIQISDEPAMERFRAGLRAAGLPE